MSILDTIAESTRARYEQRKSELPLAAVRRLAERRRRDFAFIRALRAADFAVIAEIKKASPSKGLISPDFPYLKQAKSYAAGGADAVSCLTEPQFFLGTDEIFSDIRKNFAALPMLRKDFVLDEYQIYESAVLGADCVLLICSLLDEQEIKDCLAAARSLGLSALVECRDAAQIESALKADAGIIGVNNRNLADFTVDGGRAKQLRALVPENKIFISESGITSPEEAKAARLAGADGVLIGEALMRSRSPAEFIRECKNV